MTGILPRLIALSLCIFPSVLFALGLGDIRLKSALNEPLDAEIDLVSATPDELTSLRAALASRETFVRYGLERPNFLSELDFRVGRSDDGRNVLYVRSRDSVSEPFLTFLVEVNWSRGRLLREYTLLLDPPVYMPGGEQQAAAPVAAPQASQGTTERSGAVERPAEPSPEQAAPGVSRPSAAMSADGSYTVRRNDTLYQIARGLKPGSASEVNRMMIALYRANPGAFRSNMNELQAGAILRQPSEADVDSLSAGDALAEVRRQYADWRVTRGTGAAAGSEEARLRLVTPSEGGEGTAAAGDSRAAAAQNRALQDRVNQLESDLAESRRALELRNAELARLQRQLGQQPAVTPPAEAQPTPVVPPVEEATPQPEPSAEAPSEEPAVAEPTPTPPVETEPARPRPAAETEEGIVDWLIANWLIAVGALLLLLAIAYGLIRRRRQEPDYGALGRMAAAEAAVSPRSLRGDREPVTSPVRAPKARDQDAFLVEESGERTQLRPNRTAEIPRVVEKPRAEPKARSSDDTLSSETAINLDQGDPLAEADFHMAYGLYDQAADLVRIAIEREPQRRDLKLKLLEIFFVWGNKDSFLQTARQLHSTGAEAAPGEWDKIVIMGRQIAPENPIFSQAGPSSAGGDVDLNLEGGENRVDLDLMEPPGADSASGAIDIDFGDADDQASSSGVSPALQADAGLDFPLEETQEMSDGSATTREMTARTMETPTIEQPGLGGHDSPTVESPALRERGSSTVKEKIDSALFRKDAQGSDQTAELALDDLGLDLDALRRAESETPIESMEQTDHPSDAATMVAGLDERSRRTLADAESRSRDEDTIEQAGKSPTGTWVLDDKTLAATVQLPGANNESASTDRVRALDPDTARRRRLDVDSTAEMGPMSEEEMDLDLGRLEKALQSDTARQPRAGSADDERFSSEVFSGRDFASTDIDVDVGAIKRDRDTAPTGTARIPATDMSELEPVTMSEVGTKLDLARAYMDMGDPEGARSILEEVLQEGSATQKQEAERLIESLPG